MLGKNFKKRKRKLTDVVQFIWNIEGKVSCD